MKLFDKRRIVKLMASCSDLLPNADVGSLDNYIVTSQIPGKELLDIYARRFNISGDKYEGFSELMDILPRVQEEKIKVHSFRAADRKVFVFTDSKVGRIHGLLVERV